MKCSTRTSRFYRMLKAFWYVTPCCRSSSSQSFGRSLCLHFKEHFLGCASLRMRALRSVQTLRETLAFSYTELTKVLVTAATPSKMVCTWCVHGVSVVCPWCFRGVSMVCPWCVHGVSVVCPWCVHGVSVVCP